MKPTTAPRQTTAAQLGLSASSICRAVLDFHFQVQLMLSISQESSRSPGRRSVKTDSFGKAAPSTSRIDHETAKVVICRQASESLCFHDAEHAQASIAA